MGHSDFLYLSFGKSKFVCLCALVYLFFRGGGGGGGGDAGGGWRGGGCLIYRDICFCYFKCKLRVILPEIE